jgi:X-domain of DnaJ-containing
LLDLKRNADVSVTSPRLAKDFSKAADVMITDEEREEMQREIQKAREEEARARGETPPAPTPESATPPAGSQWTAEPNAAVGNQPSMVEKQQHPAVAASTSSASNAELHKPIAKEGLRTQHEEQKRIQAEQRRKLDALEVERAKARQERVRMLADKLKARIRPYVTASKPGDPNDPECQAFERKIKLEADDLQLESFGVELCHLIGQIYSQKATTYIRLHRKATSNILGIPAFWSRVKEKGSTIKEGFSFLSTALELQVGFNLCYILPVSGSVR